ncbi:MAG TPA: RNA polymerase sigma factor [Polyangiaceae bacterium]|nr:RNA polymerase sigma factor [Polyangiaceae bacterium]
MDPDRAAVARTFKECSGRAVATLARRFGDIGVAEELVQEAFVQALTHWPVGGIPPSPAGWILTTAHRAGIDRARRESSRSAREEEGHRLREEPPPLLDEGPMIDDQLRLMFTCCHPALAPNAQVALTLRLVGGLETPEIARAFLVPEATMAQRLVRAKNKIREAKIPYRVPSAEELPGRLRWVLAAIYFVFNEGYVASQGDALLRPDLTADAIRLARHAADLMPSEGEPRGLLALLLILESRRAARVAADGSMILLREQDRSLWNRALIEEGQALVRRCLRENRPGPYQIQAAINAVHSDAASARETSWTQIVALYDQLLALTPTPVVALSRAVAVAEVDGPAAALKLVEPLLLESYHLFHAVRADLLVRLDRFDDADEAYERAITLVTNDAERRFLVARRAVILRERGDRRTP